MIRNWKPRQGKHYGMGLNFNAQSSICETIVDDEASNTGEIDENKIISLSKLKEICLNFRLWHLVQAPKGKYVGFFDEHQCPK